MWRKNAARMNQQATNDGLLWIDGVGGFLVTLAKKVTLGQAVQGNPVTVPIVGDLSRQHAVIRRADGVYWIEPIGDVQVASNPIRQSTPLSDGDEISLGSSVRLRFRQPSPLSDSARIDLLSHHRTHPSTDGVLLFGQTCLLGPSVQNHVFCPGWAGQIVLARDQKSGFFRFRAKQRVEIDGKPSGDTGSITWNTNLSGDDFALRFERT